jgi:hypothetical protein
MDIKKRGREKEIRGRKKEIRISEKEFGRKGKIIRIINTFD